MKKLPILLFIAGLAIAANATAQITKVSKTAKGNFAKQYPAAENAEWTNEVLSASVSFSLNGQGMVAEYNNKGIWKNTVQENEFEKLPDMVKEGFRLSKYADREVTDVKTVYYPGGVILYRLKVEKNDIEKKYLFFNTEGKLQREAITL